MRPDVRIFVISLISMILFSSFQKKEEIVLSPTSTIIVSVKNYPVGVKYLYKWLNKIYDTKPGSGKNFSIRREYTELKSDKDTSGKIVISVGDTHFSNEDDLKNLNNYSFVIKRKGNLIVIRGFDDIGTNLGVSYFLDHYCGVRFYLPGDLYTSMPKTNTVSLPAFINVKQSPFTKYVFSTGFYGKAEDAGNDITQWDNYWALMNGMSRKNWGSHQHTLSTLFHDSTIMKTYPEIYPIFNGEKYFPKSANDQNFEPDFAEPHLVDAALYASVKYFKANPAIDYIAFSVMDGAVYSKEGMMGEFLSKYPQTPEGYKRGYTDAYVQFLNNFAEKLPDLLLKNGIIRKKTIVYLSYSQVRDIPDEKLNASILPVTVYHLSNSVADSLYVPGGALNKWAKVTSNIGNDDWAEGRGFIYPRIYTSMVSQFVRTIQTYKLNFGYAHIEAYPNWALDGPKLYEMGKIYWNPNVNTDSLLTQFCEDMFGNASREMKNYFGIVENVSTWLNNHSATPTHLFNYMGQLLLDSTGRLMIKQASQSLENASKIARTDDERKRIDFFSKGFRISEYFFDIYNSVQVNMQEVDELKDYLKNTVAGNGRILNEADNKDFLPKMNVLLDNIIKEKNRTLLKSNEIKTF